MNPGLEKEWLLAEFKKRKAKNQAYSLRAFSRAVKLTPGRLSEYLSGKRPISLKMAQRMANELGVAQKSASQDFRAIESEVSSVVADWQHFAILSLMETRDFKSDEKWVARRLGISVLEARESIQRLLRVGLIAENKGQWSVTEKNIFTTEDIPNSATRRAHRQSLEQAIVALEDVEVELRDISSVTMAIDPSRLPLAKSAIREFRRKLMLFMEAGDASEVYNLNIQFIPLTKRVLK